MASFHENRLKAIAKSLAEAEADQKKLDEMISKMTTTLKRLNENSVKLDSKIKKYKSLYDNVKKDPDYRLPGGPDALKV